ncbi:MAG: hypothetical protein KDK40_00725, partial [Chlamydiia bacterium]|nr:hypothetical protein [Chlamydiia bacterium]
SSEFYKLTYDWEVEDFVVILPYHSWFSNDTFRLTNCRTGATIHLQLIRVFATDHSIPLCVVGFQPERQQVLLSDGSCWEVPLADRSTFLRWEQGDVVLLGINDGGLSTYYPNILINPRLDFYDSYHRYLRGCYLGQY